MVELFSWKGFPVSKLFPVEKDFSVWKGFQFGNGFPVGKCFLSPRREAFPSWEGFPRWEGFPSIIRFCTWKVNFKYLGGGGMKSTCIQIMSQIKFLIKWDYNSATIIHINLFLQTYKFAMLSSLSVTPGSMSSPPPSPYQAPAWLSRFLTLSVFVSAKNIVQLGPSPKNKTLGLDQRWTLKSP